MGIELQSDSTYSGRCDYCDRQEDVKAKAPNSAGAILRNKGWSRQDYISTASHYIWACKDCVDRP